MLFKLLVVFVIGCKQKSLIDAMQSIVIVLLSVEADSQVVVGFSRFRVQGYGFFVVIHCFLWDSQLEKGISKVLVQSVRFLNLEAAL